MSVHPARLPIAELLKQCRETRTRGSGPGGQHRNKVETAIVLSHEPSGVVGQASERRSQAENREVAIQRLRINLALACRSTDGDWQDSERWGAYLTGRLKVNPDNPEFPAILSAVLDQLAIDQGELETAAQLFRTTRSQIQKFLRSESAAWDLVQRWRVAAGKPRWK